DMPHFPILVSWAYTQRSKRPFRSFAARPRVFRDGGVFEPRVLWGGVAAIAGPTRPAHLVLLVRACSEFRPFAADASRCADGEAHFAHAAQAGRRRRATSTRGQEPAGNCLRCSACAWEGSRRRVSAAGDLRRLQGDCGERKAAPPVRRIPSFSSRTRRRRSCPCWRCPLQPGRWCQVRSPSGLRSAGAGARSVRTHSSFATPTRTRTTTRSTTTPPALRAWPVPPSSSARKTRPSKETNDHVKCESGNDRVGKQLEADPYEVHQLPGLRVYACLLGASTQPLKMKDVLASRAAFELLQKDSFSINLAELGAGTPVSVSDGHLKAVYQQLGGDVSNPGQPGADFRIFLLVLIGLARFGKTLAIMKIAGEDEPQRQARKRLTMAIRVLCDRDDRDLTQEELSLLILSLHLAAIDNSAKLQELVAKKVQILVSNRQDPEFAEGLTTQKFPRMAVHGAAELVFPSVHEIAALSLSFPDCFRSELGQELLVRVPRKAQFVKELPGSAAFLAQEMPDESDTGDTFPYLSKQELRERAGSDFFDPRKMSHSFEAQVKRALAVRKIREEKRRTRVWSPEEIRAVQEHMKNTQAGAFDETKGLDRTERVPATPKQLESAAVTATFRRVEASMALK
ncbi:unnamed protein product, partial [Effrenium voratum]